MTENATPTPATPDVCDMSAAPNSQCSCLLKSLAAKPLHIRIIVWYLAAGALFWILGWLFGSTPGAATIAVLARPVSLLLIAAAVVFTVMAGFLSIAERLRLKVVLAYLGACLGAWFWALIFGHAAPGTFAIKAVAGPLAALLLAASAFSVLGNVLRALGVDKDGIYHAPQEQ